MSETFLNGRVTLHAGDSRDVLKTLADNSIDSICTDPPYALVSIQKRFGKPGSAAPLDYEAYAHKGANPYKRASAGFMGKQWDTGETAFAVEFWQECLRVLKPGGHVVSFSGTRTYHRMVCAIEDAGFEIRDQVGWAFGSGFPKSHDVSKGIDKQPGDVGWFGEWLRVHREKIGLSQKDLAERGGFYKNVNHGGLVANWELGYGLPSAKQFNKVCILLDLPFRPIEEVEREVIGRRKVNAGLAFTSDGPTELDITSPATASAIKWQGWGTALKPAWEPICLARKPLGTGDIHVRRNVELEIRKCGYRGDIIWTDPVAENAVSRPTKKPALETKLATSAAIASAFKTENGETIIDNSPEQLAASGTLETDRSTSTIPSVDTTASGLKFSTITGGNVHVAASENWPSSHSTTLKVGEQSIENRLGTEFTTTSRNEVSRSDTESFVGIATGLVGSMDRVLIKREGNSFVWPKALPTFQASRPLNVAANVLKWGTGAINVDGCRVSTDEVITNHARSGDAVVLFGAHKAQETHQSAGQSLGRWPANIIHDGSDEVIAAFPETAPATVGNRGLDTGIQGGRFAAGERAPWVDKIAGHADSGGSAARFFYSSKADADDRLGSKHPTVKPVDLMQWLCRLVTPKGGTVLDPFSGTGTTGEAAFREGFNAVLIEREAEYQADIRRRMGLVLAGPDERARESIKARLKDQPADHGPLFGGLEPIAEAAE